MYFIKFSYQAAYSKENQQWKIMKFPGDKEKIKRMIFQFKSKKPQTLFELNDKDGRFFDLYQRLPMDSILPQVNIVYDYNCP